MGTPKSYLPSMTGRDYGCAYCDEVKRLTLEHIWGDAVEGAFPPHTHFSAKFPDGVKGDQTIGDVCQDCNNVALSPLDDHGVRLVRRYFIRSFELTPPVSFEYEDHARFSRWLLKILYNDARATGTLVEEHAVFRHYIRGVEPAPLEFSVFGGLLKPEKLPKELAQDIGVDSVEPRFNRIASFVPETGGTVYTETVYFGRMIIFYGFIFAVLVWKPDLEREERARVQVDYGSRHGYTYLRPDRTTAELRYSRLNVLDFMLGPELGGTSYDRVYRPRLV